MAKLSVNQRVFKYKQTTYQISQITSVKPFTEERAKNIEYISLDELQTLIPISIVSALVGCWSFYNFKFIFGFIAFGISGFILRYCYKQYIAREAQNSLEKFTYMYGISMRISNGDKPRFVSSNKAIIDQTHQAILDAMDGHSNVNVSFENANIEIIDSENVNLGNIT